VLASVTRVRAARSFLGGTGGTGTIAVTVPTACSHLDTIRFTELPAPLPGCEECLKVGGQWIHLRMCLVCGKLGCCDNSPSRHAAAHFHESGHPLMRSAEPDEEWVWCYVDEVPLVLRHSDAAGERTLDS